MPLPQWMPRKPGKLPYFVQRIVGMSLRGFIFPVTSFLFFTIMLTFILVLYKPSAGPSKVQRIGWQIWDQVYFNAGEDVYRPPPGTQQDDDDSSDWWNNMDADPDASVSSLPLDEWLPMQVHDTGITEITVQRCFIDHAYGFCFPPTTPEEDSQKGKWTLVERDIQQKNGIYYMAFYYRRTRRLDVPLITDFMLLGAGEENQLPHPSYEWRGVDESIRDGVMGQSALYLWYRLGKTMAELSAAEANNIITEVDILNGEGPPFFGFERMDTPLSYGKAGRSENVYMTYRRGVKKAPRAQPLHFSHHGHFRVMQIADLHFSVGHGRCKDTDHTPCEWADDETLALINRTLEIEKPDMVVFSGDQMNGQGTSWDPRSILAKFATPVIDRKIPWAVVFGNHDDEEDMIMKSEQMKIIRAMPYSLADSGPIGVHGVSNYVLAVRSPDPSRTQLLTLYFLDSGSYSAGTWDWFGFTPSEYDYIHESQIDWFLEESSSIPMHERPFTPDGGRDLGNSWRRAEDGKSRQSEERTLVKPNALMFYHIPIQETYNDPDLDALSNKPLSFGEQLDGKGSPKQNKGFFEKALLKATENDLGGREVKAVANGHSHLTNSCRRVQGIWFCFNGGSSYSGYGQVGIDRRFRIFDITEWGEKIKTWERTEHGDIVDELVLLGDGGPSPYVG